MRLLSFCLGIGGLLVLGGGCGGRSEQSAPAAARAALAPRSATAPPAALVVAGPDGAFSIDKDGSITRVVSGKVAIAVDDLHGGVLFQRASGRFDMSGVSTAIRWRKRGSAAAVDLLVRVDPRTGHTTELARVGGWEWGAGVSVTPSLIGLTSLAEAYRTFKFLGADGAPRDIPGNRLASPALDCSDCPDLLELSPDASTLAYVEFGSDDQGYRTVPQVVLLDLETGKERRRFRLERLDGGWRPASLDLGDGVLVVNRLVRGEPLGDFARPLVVDLRGEEPVIWEAPVPGNARLARSAPQVKSQ